MKIIKKITLLSAVLVSVSFVSCKKNWTCECTGESGAASFEVRSEKMKKNEAKTWCKDGSDGTEYSCKLK